MTLMEERELSDLEKQGVIQAFEYNYELVWNVLKLVHNTYMLKLILVGNTKLPT